MKTPEVARRDPATTMTTVMAGSVALGVLALLVHYNPDDWVGKTSAALDMFMVWLHDLGLHRLVLDPLQTYVPRHTHGLPVSTETVYTVWAGGGAMLLISTWSRSPVALIGWFAYGAANVALVWVATPEPGRVIAAALVGLAVVVLPIWRWVWWGLLVVGVLTVLS